MPEASWSFIRTSSVIILLVLCGPFSRAMCGFDGKTLTELLFSGQQRTIFSCKILSMAQPTYEVMVTSSDGSIDGTATAKILTVYFGVVDSSVVTLKTGWWLNVGDEYIVYCSGSGHEFAFGGNCDERSHKLTNSAVDKNEAQTLKTFAEIYRKKKSGKYDFKSHDGKLLAQGEFKKGKPVGFWRHYYVNGTLKSSHDLTERHFTEHSAGGILLVDKKEFGDSTVILIYSAVTQNELKYKNVLVPNSRGRLTTFVEYYSNRSIKQLETQQDTLYNHGSGSLGKAGPYREGYENGRTKLAGEFKNNKRVGIWIWYKEDGTEMARVDYRNGESSQ